MDGNEFEEKWEKASNPRSNQRVVYLNCGFIFANTYRIQGDVISFYVDGIEEKDIECGETALKDVLAIANITEHRQDNLPS
jgi:hypothetical protein